jgi:hypothetical protein
LAPHRAHLRLVRPDHPTARTSPKADLNGEPLVIVSHVNKFIFFHNPKCAGTSFRDMLKPYHDDELTFWGIFLFALFQEPHRSPGIFACTESYNSVIFLRNPNARFLSAVNEHMKKFQPQVDSCIDDAPAAHRGSRGLRSASLDHCAYHD